MKIVINKCFGGFCLSTRAMKMLVLAGCKALEGHSPDEWAMSSWKDAGDGFLVDETLEDVVQKDGVVYSYDEEERSDPHIIEAVEKLGKKANGRCSKLKIVEVPDGVDYTIEDHDGVEHVAERHRTWS